LNDNFKDFAFVVVEVKQITTMIKCPVLLMGKNSVVPSTKPRMKALNNIDKSNSIKSIVSFYQVWFFYKVYSRKKGDCSPFAISY